MIVARSAWQLRSALDSLTLELTAAPIQDIVRERPRVAFVPTMGALHDGHLSLVRAAREDGQPITVASVFVNPSQFAEGEDFDQYPRSEDADLELLEAAGCDIAFLPTVDDVYPPGFGTRISADPALVDCLCGASRGSEHFDGVVTVVARLFGLVRPDTAWFGRKDWQQLQVITRMAADLFPSVEIRSGETVRTSDGLALSSRNSYLSPAALETALAVPRAIDTAREVYASGTARDAELAARAELEAAGLAVDYAEARSGTSLTRLEPESSADESCEPRIFIAAVLEGVRLIDNAALFVTSTPQPAAGIAHRAAPTA